MAIAPTCAKANRQHLTCNVRAAVDATRRDFILVNEEMLDAIQGFRVMEEDTYPTHQPIQVSINLKKLKVEQRLLRKPTSAAEAFEDKIAEKLKEDDKLKENDVRKEEKKKLHGHMKDQIEKRIHRLEHAKHTRNTDRLWDLIVASMEESFTEYFDLKGVKANKMRGRNATRIINKTAEKKKMPQCEDNAVKRWCRRVGNHTAQANRLTDQRCPQDASPQSRRCSKEGAQPRTQSKHSQSIPQRS